MSTRNPNPADEPRPNEPARPGRSPWYADGLHFACTRCGNCCSGPEGYVWIDDAERDAIAKALKLTPREFHRRHVRRIGQRLSLRELPDGDCEFLERNGDGTTGCAIHAVRPLQCRTWPFWESNLTSRRAWQAASRFCPGMDQGMHHPLNVIQQQVFAGASRKL